MYTEQSSMSGGMLKRHFTMIYGQLDDMGEKMARLESNLAEVVLRMEEFNQKYTQLESSRSQISQAETTSRELAGAIEELRRDINGLRARFEAELLSLDDPVSARLRPTPAEVPAPSPATQLVETPRAQQKQEAVEPPESAPLSTETRETPETREPAEKVTPKPPEESSKKEEEPQADSEKTYETTVRSLEEELGLVPTAADAANTQSQGNKLDEKKKKHRWF